MIETMHNRIQAVLEQRARVQQAVDRLRGHLVPFTDLPLEAIRLFESSTRSNAAWSSKPCELTVSEVDLTEVKRVLEELATDWQAWVAKLVDLRTTFATVPPEDVDDLLLHFPILRDDPSLLDMSHREL